MLGENGFPLLNVWNTIETEVMLGWIQNGRVIGPIEGRITNQSPPPPGLPQNREIITIIEAVTVAGDGIPLMTILK